MGSYGEVELAQARDDTGDCPRTLALEVEVILEGLQETLSEGINRVSRLIDSFPRVVRRKLGINVNGLLGESDFNVFNVCFFFGICKWG